MTWQATVATAIKRDGRSVRQFAIAATDRGAPYTEQSARILIGGWLAGKRAIPTALLEPLATELGLALAPVPGEISCPR